MLDKAQYYHRICLTYIYLDDVAKLNNYSKRSFIIIYADDILLITVTVSALESL